MNKNIQVKYGEKLNTDDIYQLFQNQHVGYFITKVKNNTSFSKCNLLDFIKINNFNGLAASNIYDDFLEIIINKHIIDLLKSPTNGCSVGIISAGHADIKIVAQAYLYLKALGYNPKIYVDCGVDGLQNTIDTVNKLDENEINIAIAGMEANLFSIVGSISKKPVICVPSDVGFGYGYEDIAITSAYDCKYPVGVFNIDNVWGACNYCANYMYSKKNRDLSHGAQNAKKENIYYLNEHSIKYLLSNLTEVKNTLMNYSSIIAKSDDAHLAITLGAIVRDYDLKLPIIATPSKYITDTKKSIFFKTIINNCVNNITYVDNIEFANHMLSNIESVESVESKTAETETEPDTDETETAETTKETKAKKIMMTNAELFEISESNEDLQRSITSIENEHALLIKQIVNDPLVANKNSKELLKLCFSQIVNYFILSIKQVIKVGSHINLCYIKLMLLYNVQYKNTFEYSSTLNAIISCLELFDLIERESDDVKISFQETTNPKGLGVYYHFLNYKYYFDKLLLEKDCVIFQTIYNKLGCTDILTMRSVPIYFCGVSLTSVYVDEFWQSPLEFFIHDVNHSRRMFYNSDLTQLYRSYEFNKKIMEFIKINKNDTGIVKGHKQLMKMLLFEIVHEDALYMLPEVVWDAIHRDENYIYTFEKTVVKSDSTALDIKDHPIHVECAMAYTKYKLQYQFYDNGNTTWVVDPSYRYASNIVFASMLILSFIVKNSFLKLKMKDYNWYLERASCNKYMPKPVHDFAVGPHSENKFDNTALKTGIPQNDWSEGYRRIVGEHKDYKNIDSTETVIKCTKNEKLYEEDKKIYDFIYSEFFSD